MRRWRGFARFMAAEPRDRQVVKGAELAPSDAPRPVESEDSSDHTLVINLLFRYRTVLIVSFHFVLLLFKIGRASCRERVLISVVGGVMIRTAEMRQGVGGTRSG